MIEDPSRRTTWSASATTTAGRGGDGRPAGSPTSCSAWRSSHVAVGGYVLWTSLSAARPADDRSRCRAWSARPRASAIAASSPTPACKSARSPRRPASTIDAGQVIQPGPEGARRRWSRGHEGRPRRLRRASQKVQVPDVDRATGRAGRKTALEKAKFRFKEENRVNSPQKPGRWCEVLADAGAASCLAPRSPSYVANGKVKLPERAWTWPRTRRDQAARSAGFTWSAGRRTSQQTPGTVVEQDRPGEGADEVTRWTKDTHDRRICRLEAGRADATPARAEPAGLRRPTDTTADRQPPRHSADWPIQPKRAGRTGHQAAPAADSSRPGAAGGRRRGPGRPTGRRRRGRRRP